jgi:hypothetical protein
MMLTAMGSHARHEDTLYLQSPSLQDSFSGHLVRLPRSICSSFWPLRAVCGTGSPPDPTSGSMLGPCLPTPPVLLILARCDMQHDWPRTLATPRRGNRRPTTNLHRTRKQGLFFGSRGSRVYALRASSPPRRTLSCRSAMDREIRGTPMICPMPTSGASYDAHSHFGHLHPTSLLLFPPSWLMTSRQPTDY